MVVVKDDDVAFRGHGSGNIENEPNYQPRRHHRGRTRRQEIDADASTVVLAIDVQDRKDDQVGEDEGNNAAEADPPAPEHRGQGDVADRADEADHGDEWPNECPPHLGDASVPGEEDCGPHRIGYPGTERARDHKAEEEVRP